MKGGATLHGQRCTETKATISFGTSDLAISEVKRASEAATDSKTSGQTPETEAVSSAAKVDHF